MPSFFQGRILSQYLTNNNEALGGLQLEGALGGLGITGLLVRRSGGNIHVPEEKTAGETGVGTDPKFTGELDFTDFDQFNGSLGVGYSYGPGRIGVNYVHWGNEHNFLLPNGKGVGQKLENDTVQAKGILPFGGIWVAKPVFSYMENLRLSNKGGSTRDRLPDDVVIDLLLKTYTGRLEIEHSGVGILSGKLGLEYMYEDQDTRGAVPLTPSATIGNFALFAFEEAKLMDNVFLSLGARFDSRTQEVEANKILKLPDYEAGETDDILEQSYNAFSGSIGAVYRFTEELALAANVGRGFRAPGVFELHVNGEHGGVAAFQIGDPELEEEISLNSDLSIRWRSPVMQAKVTAYRNAIDNYIYLVNTEEMFVKPDDSQIPIMAATQGDAELIGLDASAQIQILPWLQLRGLFETVNGKNIDTDEKLPLLPSTKMEGEAIFNHSELGMLRNLYLSSGVRYSAEKEAAGRFEPFWQFDANPNFGVASTDAYTLLDLGLGFDLPLMGKQLSFDLAAKNILNKAYRDFLDTYKGYALSPGRNFIFKLSIPFGLSTR
jgi:iron complex outermembrane receptor protein/hemoglobin/transferrin/lactoferrin receptor protein